MVEGPSIPKDPKSELYDILQDGIAKDLFHLEEALSISNFISEHANKINEANFGLFFGNYQVILGRFLVLQTARLFEKPDRRYPIRSILTALKVLKDNPLSLKLEQRPGLIKCLVRQGWPEDKFKALTDTEITSFTIEHFKKQFSSQHVEGASNARALEAVREIRNKSIAHPESISAEAIPTTTFADIQRLMELAINFLATIGFGYLSIAYEDDSGHNSLSADAAKSALCLKRLLEAAHVLESRKYP